MAKSKPKAQQPDPADPGADVTIDPPEEEAAEKTAVSTPENVEDLLSALPAARLHMLTVYARRILAPEHPLVKRLDEIDTKKQADEPEPEPRDRQTSRPICPIHKRPMTAEKTEQFFTRYRCTVDGCTERRKQPRPMQRHHREPEVDFSAR